MRAINITYRGGNQCNFQSGEARLYVANFGVYTKNAPTTNLAKAASAKVAATTAASGYTVTDAKDNSNGTYYASNRMDYLQWCVGAAIAAAVAAAGAWSAASPTCCALSRRRRFWIDLGVDIPMADILTYWHRQVFFRGLMTCCFDTSTSILTLP